MLFTENIEELIRLAVASRYFKKEPPVNIMLICKAEAGKTELLKQFRGDGILYTTDINYMGLINNTLREIESGRINTIIIPDFIKIISKSRSTAANIQTILLGLIEEGIQELNIGSMPIRLNKEVSANLITGITPEAYLSKKKYWDSIGFTSRFIPVSFKYSPEQINAIFEHIKHQKHLDKKKYVIPHLDKDITINPNLIDVLIPTIQQHAQEEGQYGFRFLERITTLLKTSALLDNRNAVNMTDVEKLKKLIKYMNSDMQLL